MLLGLAGCEKPASESSSVEAKPVPVPDQNPVNVGGKSAEYAAKYEAAKARAVAEFPALGVAGSPFNSAFLAEANKMKERNAAELENPEWPYRLAGKVNVEQVKAREKMMQPGVRLTVQELQTLNPPPPGARVYGHVSQISVGFGGKTATITLDNALRCELSHTTATESIWIQDANILKCREKLLRGDFGFTSHTITMGELLEVEGVFSPPGTTKVLRGVVIKRN